MFMKNLKSGVSLKMTILDFSKNIVYYNIVKIEQYIMRGIKYV